MMTEAETKVLGEVIVYAVRQELAPIKEELSRLTLKLEQQNCARENFDTLAHGTLMRNTKREIFAHIMERFGPV